MAIAFMLTISNRQIFLVSKINKTVNTFDIFFLVSFDGVFSLQQIYSLFIKQLIKNTIYLQMLKTSETKEKTNCILNYLTVWPDLLPEIIFIS